MWLPLLGLGLLVALPAMAQSPSAQARRDDIARVQELVTDPDPLQRVANLEEIVAEGDAVRMQVAVRVALTGDDAMLRGLAFRAFLAGVQRFVADLSLEPAQQQRLDRARSSGDPRAMAPMRQLEHLVDVTAMRADFRITQFTLTNGRGRARVGWYRQGGQDFEFQVIGERLLTNLAIDGSQMAVCPLELRPTRDLRIEGHMVCQGTNFGRIHFNAPMY